MSTDTNPRALLAGLSAVVPLAGATSAIALAGIPAAGAAAPTQGLPAPVTTPIGDLWRERLSITQEYKNAAKSRKRLQRKLERLPDPSITFNEDNEADGLKYWGGSDRAPHTLHRYIWSRQIESKLANVTPSDVEATISAAGDRVFVMHPEPLPLSQEQLALRERLKARLEFSRAYERKIKRVSRKIGLSPLEKKIDRLIKAQNKLDHQILSLSPMTASDFEVKIAIWREWGGEAWVAGEIISDLEGLIDAAPGPLALAIAEFNSIDATRAEAQS